MSPPPSPQPISPDTLPTFTEMNISSEENVTSVPDYEGIVILTVNLSSLLQEHDYRLHDIPAIVTLCINYRVFCSNMPPLDFFHRN